jgi:paraquat-inducible protein B
MLLAGFSFAIAENESAAVEPNATDDAVAEEPVVTAAETTNETPEAMEEQPVAEETPEVVAEEAAADETTETEASAVEEVAAEPLIEVSETTEEDAGITPDSPILYGLERAMERISYSLTLGKSAKAKKGLAHALERLAEVQVMIAEKKLDAAEKASKAHGQELEQVQEDIAEMAMATTKRHCRLLWSLRTKLIRRQRKLQP